MAVGSFGRGGLVAGCEAAVALLVSGVIFGERCEDAVASPVGDAILVLTAGIFGGGDPDRRVSDPLMARRVSDSLTALMISALPVAFVAFSAIGAFSGRPVVCLPGSSLVCTPRPLSVLSLGGVSGLLVPRLSSWPRSRSLAS